MKQTFNESLFYPEIRLSATKAITGVLADIIRIPKSPV
jgi:hypothetical protein